MYLYIYIYQKKKQWRNFLHTKIQTLQKCKTIGVTFLYTKSETLYISQFFMKSFKLAFIYKEHDTSRYVTFFNTKIQTLPLRFNFICKKQCTLHYVFISIIYRIVLIPNYKHTYDQSDQIDK